MRPWLLSLLLCAPVGCNSGGLEGAADAARVEDAGSSPQHDTAPRSPVDGSASIDDDAGATPADSATPPADSALRDMAAGPSCTLGGLRSALYPDDWAPGFKDAQGRFLHDFSYAGYHHGEAPIPVGDFTTIYDVTQAPYGADATGKSDATSAIQAAIDAAASNGGGIIYLPAGTYRLEKLRVKSSKIVLRGAGSGATFLRFPNGGGNPSIYFLGEAAVKTKLALAKDAQIFDTHVALADVSGLAVGDHIVLTQAITQAFIDAHNMQVHWAAQLKKRHVFFRRRIVSIDSAKKRVSFKVPLRYPLLLRDSPKLEKVEGLIEECGIEALSLENAADTMEIAWSSNSFTALKMENVSHCWVRDVRSVESKKSPTYHLRSKGLVIKDSRNITVDNVHLGRTQNSGGGGNGYHFGSQRSSELLFKDCSGEHARHSFSIGWPFGSSGIVYLRIHSHDSIGYHNWQHYQDTLAGTRKPWSPLYSDFHMQLSIANLVDQSVLDDGWYAINRGSWSASSGMTSTQSVFWNNRGQGDIRSYQFGWGYVIGTQGLRVRTEAADAPNAPGTSGADEGTQPYDYAEHVDAQLSVPSLYEDQLARRLGRCGN